LRQGLHARAAHHARKALRQSPTDHRARSILAAASLGVGRFESALEVLEPLARERPGDPAILFNLASALRGLRRFEDAGKEVDQALAVNGADAQLIAMKARLLIGRRRLDEALRTLDQALRSMPGHPSLAIEFAKLVPADRCEEALEHLAAARRNAAWQPPPVRHALDFAHADLLERLARYEEAFAAYEAANAARNMAWDPDAHASRIDAMIAAWSRERVESLPGAIEGAPSPIFIVGMPRSGTTLLDQILSMHPLVMAGGEQMIIPRAVMRLAGTPRGVLPLLDDPSRLSRPGVLSSAKDVRDHYAGLVEDEPRVTDKFPQNMLHLGAISLLSPGAKVVHCVRDPLDTCLSGYFQNLLGTMPYMYDLEHIGRFYADYRRLMEHWREVLDLEVLEVEYERLVSDQEAQPRRLLDFLVLEWEPACLEFHASDQAVVTASDTQVANAMYTTSVERWRRHAPRLGPLVEALGELATPEQRRAVGH